VLRGMLHVGINTTKSSEVKKLHEEWYNKRRERILMVSCCHLSLLCVL
jgi:ribosomal protein L36